MKKDSFKFENFSD